MTIAMREDDLYEEKEEEEDGGSEVSVSKTLVKQNIGSVVTLKDFEEMVAIKQK